jgi:hypothetical protein
MIFKHDDVSKIFKFFFNKFNLQAKTLKKFPFLLKKNFLFKNILLKLEKFYLCGYITVNSINISLTISDLSRKLKNEYPVENIQAYYRKDIK